jgi:hypothetical protein
MFRQGNYPRIRLISKGFLERLWMFESNLNGAACSWILSTPAGKKVRGASSYCTKPTLGTGVGSGTSRMGPNCIS